MLAFLFLVGCYRLTGRDSWMVDWNWQSILGLVSHYIHLSIQQAATHQPSSVPSHTELWWASGSMLSRSSRLARVKEPRLDLRMARPSIGLSTLSRCGPNPLENSCSSSELVVSGAMSLQPAPSSSKVVANKCARLELWIQLVEKL